MATRSKAESAREALVVVDAAVAALKPWPRNPRRIRPERLEQLKAMLTASPEMLQARPLIALPDGTVIAGNQRLAAAAALGWETVPCVYVDLDDATATRWAFADNNPLGEPDDALAAELLAELAAGDVDLLLTGFAPDETQRLLASLRRSDADPDAAPDAPAEPRSVRGEVYELGPHRLMCGDATSDGDVRHLFAPPNHHALDLVEMVWTDPPYGVGYVGKTADALTIDGDQKEGLRSLLAGGFSTIRPALAPHARFYCAAPPGPRSSDFLWALDQAGWRLHETLVWVKQRMVLGHSDYHYRHEPIFYGWAADPEWSGRPGRGAHNGTRWYGGNSQDSVFEIDAPTRSAEHPTMKPVELIERHIANSTQSGVIVYDPFAGSGSTMIACENLARRARLMEIDPAYCDVIRQRYADYVDDQTFAP